MPGTYHGWIPAQWEPDLFTNGDQETKITESQKEAYLSVNFTFLSIHLMTKLYHGSFLLLSVLHMSFFGAIDMHKRAKSRCFSLLLKIL